MPGTLVILPTYNEAENLEGIATEVLAALPNAQVLVVDDRSPDGTGEIADALARKFPERIQVLHRESKQGLGKAYLAAFAHALRSDHQSIVQMDADFSHPPSLLPRLVDALGHFDLALGSRYIAEGGISNWGLKRRLVSRAGNFYARRVLGSPVRDLTGGFKAFRRPVVEALVRLPISSAGYHFQIETTSWALHAGFSFTEIPFTFVERRQGLSKMSGSIICEAFLHTLKLRQALKREAGALQASSAPSV